MFDLHGKRAVGLGGTFGIGRAVVPCTFPVALNNAIIAAPRGQELLRRTSMESFWRAEALTGAGLSLASGEASFMTGEILVADGGMPASGVNR